MPDLKPFVVTGLALGGVYSLSAVGLVVLYRTSGVINFAIGAFGAVAAYVTWQLRDDGQSEALAIVAGIAAATAVSVVFGLVFAPRFARAEAVVKAAATVGGALALLGTLLMIWSSNPKVLVLSTTAHGWRVFGAYVNLTQIIALSVGLLLTAATSIFLERTSLGLQMRSLASDRELSSLLGIRIARVELYAWLFSGVLAGVSGILLANLVRLEAAALTFLVIAALGAALVGGLRSLWVTLAAGIVIGVLQAIATPFESITSYRDAAPFLVAIVALLVAYRRAEAGTRT